MSGCPPTNLINERGLPANDIIIQVRERKQIKGRMKIMEKQQHHWLAIFMLISLTVVLAACGNSTSNALTGSNASSSQAGLATSTNATPPANLTSTISFTTTGQVSGTYTITSSLQTSELRHGHKEFTIEVAKAGQSVIMAFYGYEGPRTYTLEGLINGGDVHISFGKNATSWDLPMISGIACTLNIQSDAPTIYTSIDRMKGSFTCPRLTSPNPNMQHQTIAVREGHFDLMMLVAS